jgi:gliding motility-associated lipoprotein GldD
MKRFSPLASLVLVCFACETNWLPKPPGYNRIDLPRHEYNRLEEGYPYQFDFSLQSQVEPDSFNLNETEWINLNYKKLGAKVHLTYKKIDQNTEFKALSNDAFNLTAKHQIKAYGIEEVVILTPNGYSAVVAELTGEVPTQFQFFVTDSTTHFLRGALYFNTALKNDSLAPVIEYIKIDLAHLINTVTFEKKAGN